jgi:hypothetical protein
VLQHRRQVQRTRRLDVWALRRSLTRGMAPLYAARRAGRSTTFCH